MITPELSKTIQEQGKQLEKLSTSFARRQKWYKVLASLIKFLKVITAIVGIAALVTIFLFPPIGAIITAAAIILWIIIGTLEKRQAPSILFYNKVRNEIFPTVIKSINPSYELETEFDPYNLNESKLLSKDIRNKTSEYHGQPYIKGDVKNILVELGQVKLYHKKVHYGKSSVGCLSTILMFPIAIFNFITSGFDEVDFEFDFDDISHRELSVFQHLFHAFAHFPFTTGGELYLIPITSKNQIIDNNSELTTHHSTNEFLKNNYVVTTTKESLVEQFITPSLIHKFQQLHAKTGVFSAMSVIRGKLNIVTPLNDNIVKIDLNSKIDGETFFEPLVSHISFIEQYIQDLEFSSTDNSLK